MKKYKVNKKGVRHPNSFVYINIKEMSTSLTQVYMVWYVLDSRRQRSLTPENWGPVLNGKQKQKIWSSNSGTEKVIFISRPLVQKVPCDVDVTSERTLLLRV